MSPSCRSTVWRFWFAAFAALMICVASSCSESSDNKPAGQPAPVVSAPAPQAAASPAGGEDKLWQTDFEAAKKKAKDENRLVLADFTGSDWCGWCKKLKSEVFDKNEFKAEAPKQFVLVELDYPRQKQLPEELEQQNDKLKKLYKIRGFPTILLLDAAGQVVAKTGYRPGGPAEYLKHLAAFVEMYQTVVKMKAQLEGLSGFDRAKLLDRLVDTGVKLNEQNPELVAWSKEIIALDPDNAAGLKNKHEFRVLMAECVQLLQEQRFDESKANAEKMLKLPGLTAGQKQSAYRVESQCCYMQKDLPGAVASLEKALEADPESQNAARIQSMIDQLKPQAVMAGLKARLENAKGLDRAKILDQLIDAVANVRSGGSTDSAEKSIEWSREIVSLDPENKTGLKPKHEFRVLMADASQSFDERKFAECRAALEKVLALPNLSGEQTQDANLHLGRCYLEEKDLPKSLDCLKKALDAAPHSEQSDEIERLIKSVERDLEKEKAKK